MSNVVLRHVDVDGDLISVHDCDGSVLLHSICCSNHAAMVEFTSCDELGRFINFLDACYEKMWKKEHGEVREIAREAILDRFEELDVQ